VNTARRPGPTESVRHQPGDHVVFPASAGVGVEVGEERLSICRVVELLGVVELLSVVESAPAI
jgi:chaperonin GroES